MDLPNDASWKCSKCRRTRLPLKKEARIILRDALSTYSPLCTDNYINAVANVVCVVSDSESPHNKKNPKPPNSPKPDPPQKPSQPPPNDNTVVLRLSTDDSDLDSNVEDDIQPNPVPNSDKPQPNRRPNRNESIRQPSPGIDPSAPPEKNSSPLKKKAPKPEQVPSSTKSADGDDERPLSELMPRGVQRRSRQIKPHQSKQTDPTLASPKMRLKAKQRRLREENVDSLPLASTDPKIAREPVSLPPKRRGRKPGSKKVEKRANGKPLHVSHNSEKETAPKSGDQKNQVEVETQPVSQVPPVPEQLITMDVKVGSIKEEVTVPSLVPGNEENKEAKGAHSGLCDESVSSIDEGYPGDTEDDLPLSKRLARYRRPASPRNNRERMEKTSPAATNENHELKESPPVAMTPVNIGSNQNLKQEAVILDAAATHDNHNNVQNPNPLANGGENTSVPVEKHDSNPDLEKQSSGSWPKMKLDPKHEALFALARVQRQQPKPTESPENHVISVEAETPVGGSKVVARPKNIPESERQRIQVTALAASNNMRRNVSNMASTMAGLRPQSPRLSKGSINLLLQQNQPEAHTEMTAQRSYQRRPDISLPRHSGHQGKEEVIQTASNPHRPGREIAHNPSQIYREVGPTTQETRRNSGAFAYRDQPASGEIRAYPVPQSRSIVESGTLRISERDVPPFSKRNRPEETIPRAKRPRSNKSDISNVLATDSMIPMKDRQIMNPENRLPTLFPEIGRQTSHQAPISHSTVQVHSSDRQVQPNQVAAPYSIAPCPLPPSRFEPSDGRPGNFGMQERLTLPEAHMNHNAEGNLGTRFPSTAGSHPSIPLGSPILQPESGLQMNREDEARHTNFRAYESAPITQVQEPGTRTSSQVYPSSNIGGDSLPSRLRWPESNNPGASAPRQDYAGPSTTNQQWSESRMGNRPPQQESSYNAAVSRFVPIDRRTRRPMPYVPTATRKAQFEQGRALAFIDSRRVPPNAEPSESYRMEDRSPGLTAGPYGTRPEGSYSGPEYAFPQSGQSKATYGDEESRAQANSYHGDYYAHRQEYRRGYNQERVNEHSPYMADSQRDSMIRESVGGETRARAVDGAAYGQSRLGVLRRGQSSSGTVLEPPLERNTGLSTERKGPLPFASLVGSRVRSHQESDRTRIASTFDTDRIAPERGARVTMGSSQSERGYSTSHLQTGDRRNQGFNEIPYGSLYARRNEGLHAAPGEPIVDTRVPAPIHVEGDHYRSRDTNVGPGESTFPPRVMRPSGSGTLFSRRADQIGNPYDYGRETQEARGSVIPQNIPALDTRNEDFATDRVSNIPLVARFDNSLGGYMDANAGGRSNDRGSGMGDRAMMQRRDQGQPLPSLRSNPSLRDLLS